MSLNHLTSQSDPNPWANPRIQTLRVDGASDFLGLVNLHGRQLSLPVTLNSVSNHVATDASLSNIFIINMTEDTQIDNPTNLVAGQSLTWMVSNTVPYDITYDTIFQFVNGNTPPSFPQIELTYAGLYNGTNLLTTFTEFQ